MARFMEILIALMVVVFINGGAVKGYPKEDLVKKLPGQPEVGFKQYAGYVDVDVDAGRSLFYYFVEAHGESHLKPLTIWLNGGPGCSSIGKGAFTELGPFLPNGDGRSLRINKMSWNRVSNLLFVEAPAGVGWSYSNRSSDYNVSDESFTNDMYIFLMKWLEKFPEFKYSDLFLTGETYAGHYIPNLVNILLKHNKDPSIFKFQIKGVAIGNPALKFDRDLSATYEFLWSRGMMSDEIFLTIKRECDFEQYLKNISKTCENALGVALRMLGVEDINFYNVILDTCPLNAKEQLKLKKSVTKISLGVDVCMEYETDAYLNLPEVQHALHANRTNLPYKWNTCSQLLQYNNDDNIKNMLPLLKNVIGQQIPVWIFSGDQDAIYSLLGTRSLVRELAEELKYGITVPYGPWYYNGQIGGWVIEYGNLLTFATVRGGAEMVAYSQPGRAFQLFKSFVHGERLTNRNT